MEPVTMACTCMYILRDKRNIMHVFIILIFLQFALLIIFQREITRRIHVVRLRTLSLSFSNSSNYRNLSAESKEIDAYDGKPYYVLHLNKLSNLNSSTNQDKKHLYNNLIKNRNFEKFYQNIDLMRLQDPLLHLHQFKIASQDGKLCTNKNVFLLMFVHSAPYNLKERNLVRSTWGSVKYHKGKHIEYIFVLGETTNLTLAREIQKESIKFKDIVQGNFVDSYRNVTYKHVFGLYWITNFCINAEFVIKLDDDVIVNLPLVLEHLDLLNRQKEKLDLMECKRKIFDHPYRVESKWQITRREYQPSTFPPYCIGLAYITTVKTLSKYLIATKKVPFFWVDDVYVGGFLPWVTGVRIKNISNFKILLTTRNIDIECELSEGQPQYFFYLIHNKNLLSKHWKNCWKTIFEFSKHENNSDNSKKILHRQ